MNAQKGVHKLSQSQAILTQS